MSVENSRQSPLPGSGMVYRPRICLRDRLRFVALRAWLSTAKRHDLQLLHSAKYERNFTALALLMASEIAELVRFFTGGNFPAGWAVTNAPPGTSLVKGTAHLATAIGEDVAALLGLPHVTCFEPGAPARTRFYDPTAKRIGLLDSAPKGLNLILVDDLVTTGCTMTECYNLLSPHAALLPVAWLYGEAEPSGTTALPVTDDQLRLFRREPVVHNLSTGA